MNKIYELRNEEHNITFELYNDCDNFFALQTINGISKKYPLSKESDIAFSEFNEEFNRCVAYKRYRQRWWF